MYLGWALCVVGAVLFVVSNVASLAGVVVLPFDSHHVFGQLGGGAMVVIGLIMASRR